MAFPKPGSVGNQYPGIQWWFRVFPDEAQRIWEKLRLYTLLEGVECMLVC